MTYPITKPEEDAMIRGATALRLLVALVVLALGAPLVQAQRRSRPVKPIAVVDLKRTSPVDYRAEIQPILFKKCAFCHRDNITEGGLDMGTYETLMKGGRRGKPIIPGNGAKSLLYLAAGRTKKPYMPPRGEKELTPQELALIKVWIDQGAKAPSGETTPEIVKLTPLPASVHPSLSVAVAPDKSVVAGSRGNQIHLYETTKGEYLRSFVDPDLKGPKNEPIQAAHQALVESLAFSPDGKILASGSFQEVLLWDFQTGKIIRRLTGFADRVVALDFSPDGKLLATGGGAPTQDGEIKIFDVASGNLVLDVPEGHSDTVFGVAFSPDGKILATCGADKFVKTFEVPSGKFIKSFEGHSHHVLGVGWKGDGKRLASAGADNVVKIWDFEKGEQIRTIKAHSKQVTRLVFVGKGSIFATCSGDQRVRMWNVDNGGNTRNFPTASAFLYAVAASPDGGILAAGGEDGIVHIYNGSNGRLIKSVQPPEPPATPGAENTAKK
jgi:WD40 repeat protein